MQGGAEDSVVRGWQQSSVVVGLSSVPADVALCLLLPGMSPVTLRNMTLVCKAWYSYLQTVLPLYVASRRWVWDDQSCWSTLSFHISAFVHTEEQRRSSREETEWLQSSGTRCLRSMYVFSKRLALLEQLQESQHDALLFHPLHDVTTNLLWLICLPSMDKFRKHAVASCSFFGNFLTIKMIGSVNGALYSVHLSMYPASWADEICKDELMKQKYKPEDLCQSCTLCSCKWHPKILVSKVHPTVVADCRCLSLCEMVKDCTIEALSV